MGLNRDILIEAEGFVRSLHEKNDTDKYYYHDLNHTLDVVYYSQTIAEREKLPEDQYLILMIAAWFHDTGYFIAYEEHEKNSVVLLKEFLAKYDLDTTTIESISRCICTTRIPQSPSNLIEEIICDADMYHLALMNFYQKTEALRLEQNYYRNTSINKLDFCTDSLQFMVSHEYKTEYGIRELNPIKQNNIDSLKKRIKKLKKKSNDLAQNGDSKESTPQAPTSARSIETMFRTTSRNQIHLSSIADNKANILISVNSIIISIIVTMLITRFNDYPNIIIPSIVLLLTNLITVIYAILATRPNLPSGKFNLEKVKEGKVNLLFFGSYYKMEYDEYSKSLKNLLKKNDGLYNNMIMDQFWHGKVLGKKYALVRKAYTIFMYGIIISVLAFAIAIVITPV
jgi:HD superfamily phosphodiesterase